MVMQSVNPATEEVLETFEEFSTAQADDALQQAYDAQRRWRETSFGEGPARLQAVARVLRSQKTRWANLATEEMGKPIVEAEAEVEKCAWNCDFYAEHAAHFLADEHVETNAAESFVAFEPLGVVLADADLDAAAATAVRARNQNNGQSCIAAKRFIVEEPVADQFTQQFADAVTALRGGDPRAREKHVRQP